MRSAARTFCSAAVAAFLALAAGGQLPGDEASRRSKATLAHPEWEVAPLQPRRRSPAASSGLSVTNLGLAVPRFGFPDVTFDLGDDLVIALVDEADQGVDLNGDGDLNDAVLQVYEISTGKITNTQLAGVDFPVLDEALALVQVDEWAAGNVDLNGDGDTSDLVFHLHDPRSVTTVNTGLSTRILPTPSSQTMASQGGFGFVWREELDLSGSVDLNGDGDVTDEVLQPFRIATHNPLRAPGIVPLFALRGRPAIDASLHDGDTAFVRVREDDEGASDRNGDGDLLDGVLAVVDLRRARVRNLGLAIVDASIGDPYVTFRVSEAEQGNLDLNGDGDATDVVGHAYDRRSGDVINLGLATSTISSSGERILMVVDEAQQAALDRNGDGDALDGVLCVRDLLAGSTTNLGLSGTPAQHVGPRLVFSVLEFQQGMTDLNGDGDPFDAVLFNYELASGIATNMLAAVERVEGDREVCWIQISEQDSRADFNFDTDTDDQVAAIYNGVTDQFENLALSVDISNPLFDFHRLGEGDISFTVWEVSQGNADLNGDGDANDRVLHVYDAASDTLTNFGLSTAARKHLVPVPTER